MYNYNKVDHILYGKDYGSDRAIKGEDCRLDFVKKFNCLYLLDLLYVCIDVL